MRRIIQKHSTLAARLFPRLMLAVLVAGALLVPARATHAAGSPAQQCQGALSSARAKYYACHEKGLAKFYAGAADSTKLNETLAKCLAKYTATFPKLQAKYPFTNCSFPRFWGDANGTHDRLTGLLWADKKDDGSVHDVNNLYSWSTGSEIGNGSVFSVFLAALNGGGSGYGYLDWRLPTLAELQTILYAPYPCGSSPCISTGYFGPTVAGFYWSATTFATNPFNAWFVYFNNGFVNSGGYKNFSDYVRAVRADW